MSVLLALQGAPGDITGSGASVLVLTDTGTAFLIFEGAGSSSLILVDAGTGQLIFEGNGASTLVLVDAGTGMIEGAAPTSGGGGKKPHAGGLYRLWLEQHAITGAGLAVLQLQDRGRSHVHAVVVAAPGVIPGGGQSVVVVRGRGQGHLMRYRAGEHPNDELFFLMEVLDRL